MPGNWPPQHASACSAAAQEPAARHPAAARAAEHAPLAGGGAEARLPGRAGAGGSWPGRSMYTVPVYHIQINSMLNSINSTMYNDNN